MFLSIFCFELCSFDFEFLIIAFHFTISFSDKSDNSFSFDFVNFFNVIPILLPLKIIIFIYTAKSSYVT